MHMTKRLLALLLAATMLLPLAACGTNTEDPTSPDGQTTEAATEGETDFFPDIQKTDYQGQTLQMIGFNEPGTWYYSESMSSEQGSVHVLNNTIYEMNTLVEDYLGIEIAYEQITNVVTGGEAFDAVQPTILSGDDVYQLCILHPYYSYVNFITQNYALDFNDLPDFNPDQPYWNAEVMDRLSINGHRFIGLGDFCHYDLNIIYVNKDKLAEAGREMPYEKVRNGEWTLDDFFALTTGLYADDGDGRRNNKDTYGFAAMWDANGTAFMQGCDIYVATRNEEDLFELSLYGERLEAMYTKLYDWSKEDSTYLWSFGNRENGSVKMDFLDGNTYVTHNKLGTLYLEAEFALGILPMPKYDTAQAEYRHVNWGNNIVIPGTVKNKEMVGEALELLGYYSKTLVQEKYYDEVLQLRVSEAPDDRDMVELIYNTVVFDPGIAFCDGNNQLWNLVYLPCFAIINNNKSISAYYKSNSRSAQRWLDTLFTKVE